MLKSHQVFLASNGEGPWPCAFCQEPVAKLGPAERAMRSGDGIVHHHDGNHGNNEPGNLRPAHNGCHVSYHRSLITWPYQHLAEILRGRIQSGELSRRVPSLKRLMAEYDVADRTVREALNILRDDGLIVSVPGRGTFIRS